MSDHCNYSLVTGKVVASICKVDVSTLSLQATFLFGKVGGRAQEQKTFSWSK